MAHWSWSVMLKRRGRWLYYRKAIPKNLRGLFGGKHEVVVSLKTQDESVARARVLEVALETERTLQRARDQVKRFAVAPEALARQWREDVLREDQRDRIDRPRDLDPDSTSGASLDTEIEVLTEAVRDNHEALVAGDLNVIRKVLKDVLTRYRVSLAPRQEKQLAHALLRENDATLRTMLNRATGQWHGDEPTPVGPIVSEVVERWLTERKPPRQTAHEVKAMLARFVKANDGVDLDVTKVTKREVRMFREALLAPDAKTGKGKGALAPATVRKNLTLLGTIFAYAMRTGLIEANPVAGMAYVARGKTQDLEKRRRPFSDEAVRVFLANLDGQSETMQRIGRILFYSGMRLAEAGNLRGADVQEREGVLGFSIAPSDSTSVKTPTAVRFVPLHSELLKGDLVALAGKRGSGFLFPDLSPNTHGKRTSALSKAFARYLRKLTLDDGGRIVMHSARHTVADKLRESGTQESVISAILGHAHQNMTGRYGRGWSPKVMAEAVESIRY